MEEPPSKRNPAASLTDDLLVEILRRLPVRSVCRFKCVSRSWRKLISDPVHRKKLPHTLTGFFYESYNGERFPYRAYHFTNITGKGAPFIFPSFSFLPVPGDEVFLLDSCNGLLLCRCYEPRPHDGKETPFHYAVCNPATKKWVMLPDGSRDGDEIRISRLGFDPTVSSHFHVINYVIDEGECVIGVEIYSSKTGSWGFKESDWGNDVMLHDRARGVFLNGFMHVLTFSDTIIAVDMDGKTWRTIPIPEGGDNGCIHLVQGCLFLVNVDSESAFKLSIWILEDYATHEWTLKHTVSTVKLFRKNNLRYDMDYTVITVHPECHLIFFVFGRDCTLMAYEMDCKEVRIIRNLGHDCSSWEPYLPYVPCFLEALADE